MFRRLFAWIQKYERHLSVVAMLGGILLDQLFFERVDLWQTQAVFAGYTLTCFISIPLLHWIEERAARGVPRPRWRSLVPLATQFALGGFWSGFLVFYGRSAVLGASWPFLLVLILILIGNEYFARYHTRLVFTSVLFFFALYSYAIFAVPVYTGTIGPWTFLGSTLLAFGLFALFTMFLRFVGHSRFRASVWQIRLGAGLVVAFMVTAYFTSILPPLPLAAKAVGVYHSVTREGDTYVARMEAQPWYQGLLGTPEQLHTVAGESLYAYSAVFAPIKLTTTISHEWQKYNESTKAWDTISNVSFPISGGRDGGYRGYSAKAEPTAGRWRVNIKTDDGRLIARVPFVVVPVSLPPTQTDKVLK